MPRCMILIYLHADLGFEKLSNVKLAILHRFRNILYKIICFKPCGYNGGSYIGRTRRDFLNAAVRLVERC